MTSTPPVRVLCWNILEGWHHPRKKGELPRWDAPRLAAARALVDKMCPDIVVLNEALWSRPFKDYVVDYARELGFEHAFCDTYDGAWGNAILARTPFTQTHRFRIHNRGGLRVAIERDGWTLGVATYHPHPSRYPHNKASDYESIIPVGYPHPLLVCGDFNAISPEDGVDPKALEDAFRRFSKHPEADVARFIGGGEEVFAALRRLGLRDAMLPQWRKPTIPTDLLSTDKSSGMRIDHAWVNDHARVLQGGVVMDPLAELASDHYPIFVDIAPHEDTR